MMPNRDPRDFRDSRDSRYRDSRYHERRDFTQQMPYWLRDENPRQGFGGMRPLPHDDDWRYADEHRHRTWDRRADIFARSEGEEWRGRFFGLGPRGYRRSDERIREEICDRLTTHPDVDATDIDVRVAGGIVTLSGEVDDRHQKRVAEFIAEDALGVDDVSNELKVRHGFWASVTGERAVERELHRDADLVDRDVGRPSSVSGREESARISARRDSESR